MIERNLFLGSVFRQSFRFDPEDRYCYLSNAKAGCTSIKTSLLIRHLEKHDQPVPGRITDDMVHGPGFWTYDCGALLANRPFTFSVVRNPFSRVLSAYLTKIGRPNNARSRPRFCRRHGYSPNDPISFIDFLRRIDGDDVVQDQHWRPQVQNLFVGSLPIDMVIRLESLAANLSRLERTLGFEFKGGVRNQRDASPSQTLAAHYTDEAIDIVRRVYRRDFETFGYSDRIDDAGDASSDPMAFTDCDAGDQLNLRAVQLLDDGRRRQARKLLEPRPEEDDVVRTLLLAESILDRETVPEVRELVKTASAHADAEQPIVRLLRVMMEFRIAKLRENTQDMYRVAKELKDLATFVKLPREKTFKPLRRFSTMRRLESAASA